MDNKDGTLSIFGTMLDFAAPTGIPASGHRPFRLRSATLGAIGRVLTYNDPQQGGGGTADGEADGPQRRAADPRPAPLAGEAEEAVG